MKEFAGDTILHMCTKNHNYMMYGSWDKVRLTDLFVILDHFLPFVPDPENLNFEKIKKTPEDIIILQMRT